VLALVFREFFCVARSHPFPSLAIHDNGGVFLFVATLQRLEGQLSVCTYDLEPKLFNCLVRKLVYLIFPFSSKRNCPSQRGLQIEAVFGPRIGMKCQGLGIG